MRQPEVPTSKRPEVVRVSLLGGFRVSLGSRTIEGEEWHLRKAAALVKLLALAPDYRLHREQAMDLLWPDLGRRAASNNMRQALYAARRTLSPAEGSRYLASENESLVLCPGDNRWVDVDAFEAAAATARRAKEPATYRAALDLYAGELLPDDRYEEWADGRREELRQLYLALLIELAGLYEERDEQGLAIEALREATAKAPTFEEAHMSLMRLHAISGRPEQALAQYERLRDTLLRALGTQPSAPVRRLRDEIAAGSLTLAPPASSRPQEEELSGAGRHNLPAVRTSFVGREAEMVEAKRLLSMTRLLTLTGAGGSGKTRLALEVARDLVSTYPDGVWLVELAPLSEGGLVTQEVAGALEVPERPGELPTGTLVDTLADKEMLLILDNCEHLVEPAARLADALLSECPKLRILATSREPLGVSGEVLWLVPPLSLPATMDGGFTAESLMRCEAVRLFVDRARQRLPDFGLTQDNASAVARVCRKLEGIPLAIELATARMGALAVEQVAQRLDTSLDVLKGASRTAEIRQQTLRATLDWSYDLLSEVERAMFGRLSVFAGGWTLEAAEAVCSGSGIEEDDVLDLLGGLVDKSLVVARASSTGGAVRYRMLEPIRQYAREKLEESGEADYVRERHTAFFLALAEEAEPELAGSQQSMWVKRLEAEHDNVREALSWSLERGRAELAPHLVAALWRFWHIRGYLSEGIRWLEQALSGSDPAAPPVRVKVLEGMGGLTQTQGDTERSAAAYEEMLRLSRELDDNRNIATALNSLGALSLAKGDNERTRALLEENMSVLQELEDNENAATALQRYHVLGLMGLLAINAEGDYARGAALWEECLMLARQIGDPDLVGQAISNLGYTVLLHGEHARARALCEEALAFARELGSLGVAIVPEALVNLGLAALGQGEHERADASFDEALAVSQEAGRKPTVINALEGMASLAAALGESTRAAHLWGAARAAREATGIALPPGELVLHEPYLASARSRLGEAAWEEALSEGRTMSLEEAAEYALSKQETDPPAAHGSEEPPAGKPIGKLSSREQEVTLLVARGLTNRQISTQLSISERTVENHVAKILSKLEIRSRAQIASWATERRLLTTPDPD